MTRWNLRRDASQRPVVQGLQVSLPTRVSARRIKLRCATGSFYITAYAQTAKQCQIGYCRLGARCDIDTSAFSVGDILYASPTVAGDFTATKPTAPDNVIPLAAVLEADATNGEIFVPDHRAGRYYGEFYNTAGVRRRRKRPMRWRGAGPHFRWHHRRTCTQITVSESGLYQFNARVQFSSGNSSFKSAWVWWN
jgi:hypothetical protein